MCTTTNSCGKYLHPRYGRQIAIKGDSWCANWFTWSVFRSRTTGRDRPPLRPPHRRKLRLDSGTASIRHVREILLLDEIKKRCHRNATIPLYLLLGAVTFPWSSIEPSMDGTSRVLVRSGCYIRRSRSRVEVKSVGVIRRNG